MRKKLFLLICGLSLTISSFAVTITFCNGSQILQRDVTSGGSLNFPTASELTCPNSNYPLLAGWTTDNITSVTTNQPALITSASNITADAVYYAIWKDNPPYTWEQVDNPIDAKNAYIALADLTTHHVQLGANLTTITNTGATPNNDALVFKCEAVSGISNSYYLRPASNETQYLAAYTGTPYRYDVSETYSAYYNKLTLTSTKANNYWTWSTAKNSLVFHETPNSQDERNIACQYQLTYNTYNNRNRIEAMGYLYYRLASEWAWVGASNLQIWKRGDVAATQYIGYAASITTLDPNGGTLNGSSASQILTSEVANNLPQCVPATGKVFLGWSKNAKATTPEYGYEASYTLGEPCTLYAIYGNRNSTYWGKVTSLPVTNPTTVIIVVSDSYGTSAALTHTISSSALETTPVTIQNDRLMNPTSNMQWTWEGTNNGAYLKNGQQYLHHNSGQSSFVYSDAQTLWRFAKYPSNSTDGFWIYHSESNYYDFGAYSSNNSTSVKLKSKKASYYYTVEYMHNQYTDQKNGILPHLSEATTSWFFAIFNIFVPQSASVNYVFVKRGNGTWTDGDANTDKIMQVMANGSITLPNVTPPEDFRFDGWTDGKNTYAAGASVVPAADMVFRPIYTSVISTITLSESVDNSSVLVQDSRVNVNTVRSLSAGSLNTFCIPFSVTSDEFESFFGTNCQLYVPTYTSLADNVLTIHCEDVNPKAIVAGMPYLIRPASAIINPTFSKRTITEAEPQSIQLDNLDYVGIYNRTLLTTQDDVLFLGQGDYLYRPATNGYMNGLRAYFRLNGVNAAPIQLRVITGHSITTETMRLEDLQHKTTKFISNGKLFLHVHNSLFDAQGHRIK